MEIVNGGENVFVRLEPGESIVESLKTVARELDIRAASITSGVGMVSLVEFGFFCIPKDNYDRQTFDGIYDLSSIQGNITWLGDQPAPHVHMTVNTPEYETLSGHVIEARCHITMEIFMQRLDDLSLSRVKLVEHPATRITKAGPMRGQ